MENGRSLSPKGTREKMFLTYPPKNLFLARKEGEKQKIDILCPFLRTFFRGGGGNTWGVKRFWMRVDNIHVQQKGTRCDLWYGNFGALNSCDPFWTLGSRGWGLYCPHYPSPPNFCLSLQKS
jgi:hypothetical protein